MEIYLEDILKFKLKEVDEDSLVNLIELIESIFISILKWHVAVLKDRTQEINFMNNSFVADIAVIESFGVEVESSEDIEFF